MRKLAMSLTILALTLGLSVAAQAEETERLTGTVIDVEEDRVVLQTGGTVATIEGEKGEFQGVRKGDRIAVEAVREKRAEQVIVVEGAMLQDQLVGELIKVRPNFILLRTDAGETHRVELSRNAETPILREGQRVAVALRQPVETLNQWRAIDVEPSVETAP